jgi:hypothetical protein
MNSTLRNTLYAAIHCTALLLFLLPVIMCRVANTLEVFGLPLAALICDDNYYGPVIIIHFLFIFVTLYLLRNTRFYYRFVLGIEEWELTQRELMSPLGELQFVDYNGSLGFYYVLHIEGVKLFLRPPQGFFNYHTELQTILVNHRTDALDHPQSTNKEAMQPMSKLVDSVLPATQITVIDEDRNVIGAAFRYKDFLVMTDHENEIVKRSGKIILRTAAGKIVAIPIREPELTIESNDDVSYDVAVYALSNAEWSTLGVKSCKAGKMHSTAFTITYFDAIASSTKMSTGIVTTPTEVPFIYHHTASTRSSSSGSPLVANGYVIGIHCGVDKSTGENYFMSMDLVVRLLNDDLNLLSPTNKEANGYLPTPPLPSLNAEKLVEARAERAAEQREIQERKAAMKLISSQKMMSRGKAFRLEARRDGTDYVTFLCDDNSKFSFGVTEDDLDDYRRADRVGRQAIASTFAGVHDLNDQDVEEYLDDMAKHHRGSGKEAFQFYVESTVRVADKKVGTIKESLQTFKYPPSKEIAELFPKIDALWKELHTLLTDFETQPLAKRKVALYPLIKKSYKEWAAIVAEIALLPEGVTDPLDSELNATRAQIKSIQDKLAEVRAENKILAEAQLKLSGERKAEKAKSADPVHILDAEIAKIEAEETDDESEDGSRAYLQRVELLEKELENEAGAEKEAARISWGTNLNHELDPRLPNHTLFSAIVSAGRPLSLTEITQLPEIASLLTDPSYVRSFESTIFSLFSKRYLGRVDRHRSEPLYFPSEDKIHMTREDFEALHMKDLPGTVKSKVKFQIGQPLDPKLAAPAEPSTKVPVPSSATSSNSGPLPRARRVKKSKKSLEAQTPT